MYMELLLKANYYSARIFLLIVLVWVVVKMYLVFKRLFTSGSASTGGRSAGPGRGRIGPKD